MENDVEIIDTSGLHKNQQANFQVEFEEFIYFHNSDIEEDEEDLEEDDDEPGSSEAVFVPTTQNYMTVTSLKMEEKLIIDSCTSPHLKSLLYVNRMKRMQLIQLHKYLKDFLCECQENIRAKETYITKMKTGFVAHSFLNPWKLAAPYFKDKNLFPSPRNIDAVLKQNAGELSIYDRGPSSKWTPQECETLIKAVPLNYNINKQKDKYKRIASLKCRLNKVNIDKEKCELEDQIVTLENEVKGSENLKDDIPPLNNNTFIDWYRISDFFLKGRHTPGECQAFWNVYLHPFINRKNWTEEENMKIIELVKKYKCQNWDKIAEELNTNRTGFLTCVHYSSILCDKYRKDKFTPEEDRMIIDIVNKCRVGNKIKWRNVAQHFTDRSRTQIFHRYTYYLTQQQDYIKRTKFSEAEDALLLLLVQRFGKNFKKCAEYVPHRTYMQLKNRYNSNLEVNIRKGTWNTEDDRLILEHVEQNGSKSWSRLTKVLKRSRGQLRQRYLFLEKFLSENPDKNLSEVPKRKHVIYEQDQSQYNFLKYIADKYKNVDKVPTLEAIENCLQVDKKNKFKHKKQKRCASVFNSSKNELKNIDSLLTDFFSNVYKVEEEQKDLRGLRYNEVITDVNLIFNSLAVTLEIPDTFKENPCLDDIDIKILNQLHLQKQNKQAFPNQQGKQYIPPNISSLIGLRSLLIKYESYKSLKKMKNIFDFIPVNRESLENTLLWSIENNLAHLDASTRSSLLLERKQFEERFTSLFYWPSILSLERPQMDETCQSVIQKTYKRKFVGGPQKVLISKKLKVAEVITTTENEEKKQSFSDSKSVNACKTYHSRKKTENIDDSSNSNTFNNSCKLENSTCLFLIQNITASDGAPPTVAVPVAQTKPSQQLHVQELPSSYVQNISFQSINIEVPSTEINSFEVEIHPTDHSILKPHDSENVSSAQNMKNIDGICNQTKEQTSFKAFIKSEASYI